MTVIDLVRRLQEKDTKEILLSLRDTTTEQLSMALELYATFGPTFTEEEDREFLQKIIDIMISREELTAWLLGFVARKVKVEE